MNFVKHALRGIKGVHNIALRQITRIFQVILQVLLI